MPQQYNKKVHGRQTNRQIKTKLGLRLLDFVPEAGQGVALTAASVGRLWNRTTSQGRSQQSHVVLLLLCLPLLEVCMCARKWRRHRI